MIRSGQLVRRSCSQPSISLSSLCANVYHRHVSQCGPQHEGRNKNGAMMGHSRDFGAVHVFMHNTPTHAPSLAVYCKHQQGLNLELIAVNTAAFARKCGLMSYEAQMGLEQARPTHESFALGIIESFVMNMLSLTSPLGHPLEWLPSPSTHALDQTGQ